MARSNRKTPQDQPAPAVDQPVLDQEAPLAESDQPTADQPAPAADVPVVATRLRLPYPEAKDHNKQFSPVALDAVAAAANVALTSKGTNPRKLRVYGYDNLGNGGGVPKAAQVRLVPGATLPKGVSQEQWDALVAHVTANPATTVQQAYDAKIAARTVRRAYRAGAIRFAA